MKVSAHQRLQARPAKNKGSCRVSSNGLITSYARAHARTREAVIPPNAVTACNLQPPSTPAEICDNDTLAVPVLLTFHAGAGEPIGVPASLRARKVLKLLERRFGFKATWLAAPFDDAQIVADAGDGANGGKMNGAR